MSHGADHVTLSSGQVAFADPSLPWTPNNFPNLPSSMLSLTATGQIAGRDLSTLAFKNTITYEPFEGSNIRAGLIKTLQVDAAGIVSYADPHVGLVSTYLTAFDTDVRSFAPDTIGAPGIDSAPPDTVTNAIAKLDAWIATAMLVQPPAVNISEIESNSLYGGVRWNNFKSYKLLDQSVPYVSGIVFILGDPATGNYLTLELTNSDWFPDRLFTDGLLSDFNPIVRLRVFSTFFPAANGSIAYSKQVMQKKCVRIVGEGGTYTLPSQGKVFSIDESQNGDTYTTVNLYLPNVPINTNIPVRIIYINKTRGSVNIATTNIKVLDYSGPGRISTITQVTSTPTSMGMRFRSPLYADVLGNVSTPYFSSYNISYGFSYMNYATTQFGNYFGYRYGQASPFIVPDFISSYVGSTFVRSYAYTASTQTIDVIGLDTNPLYPGIAWTTTAYATNMAQLRGSTITGPYPSITAFPITQTKNISSIMIQSVSPFGADAAASSLRYLTYGSGWNASIPVSTNVIFMSSQSQLYEYQLSEPARLNDITYPGATSNVPISIYYTDVSGALQSELTFRLSTFMNDFIESTFTVTNGSNILNAIIQDSQSNTNIGYKKYFYDVGIFGSQIISTISQQPQSLFITLTQPRILPNGTIPNPALAPFSTHRYVFTTEPDYPYSTTNIIYNNNITSTIKIGGLLTPTSNSVLTFDMKAVNFANRFGGSNLGFASLFYDTTPYGIDPADNSTVRAVQFGSTRVYSSNVRIFNGTSEITTLPFPQDVQLTISTCTVLPNSNYYQDPADPRDIYIVGEVTPVNVGTTRSTYSKSLTSNFFIDTVSASSFMNFASTTGTYGLRTVSLLPRVEAPGSVNNMNDSIDVSGNSGQGLNVSVSSFFRMTGSNTLNISSFITYNHVSSISSVWTNYYSRELLYTNGGYQHPGGLNFNIYNGALLGDPTAIYPNFTYDLFQDSNLGYRYAQFAFELPTQPTPQPFQYITIRVNNPSAISTIDTSRTYNFNFPNDQITASNLQYSKVRMHMKVLGAFVESHYSTIETAWINCFKPFDYNTYDDGTFDVGGCVSVRTSSSDVFYKVQINRRDYTKLCPIIRIGIARDGSAENIPEGTEYLPISFESVEISASD